MKSTEGTAYTSFSYDSRNRVQTISSSSAAPLRYNYDDQDRLTDFISGSDSINVSFNDSGRVAQEQTAKYKTVYTYDVDGNPIRANSTSRKRSYIATYSNGRVTSLLSNRRALTFERNQLGNMTAIVEKNVGKYVYGRNPLGWLVNEQLPEGYSKKYPEKR